MKYQLLAAKVPDLGEMIILKEDESIRIGYYFLSSMKKREFRQMVLFSIPSDGKKYQPKWNRLPKPNLVENEYPPFGESFLARYEDLERLFSENFEVIELKHESDERIIKVAPGGFFKYKLCGWWPLDEFRED